MRNIVADQATLFDISPCTLYVFFMSPCSSVYLQDIQLRSGIMMPNKCQNVHCFSFLLLIFLFQVASSTPAFAHTPPLTLFRNSSDYQPNPFRTHCIGYSSWVLPEPGSLDDCGEAVDHLYLTDYGRFLGRNFQFLATNAAPSPRLSTTASTPRRYTIGRCTVAVVMLTDFPSSQPLPGKPLGPYPPRDIASFRNVWGAALRILRACVEGQKFAGWEVIGRDEGIGVFIWSRGSEIDRAVGGLP